MCEPLRFDSAVTLPNMSSPRPKLSRKRRIDWSTVVDLCGHDAPVVATTSDSSSSSASTSTALSSGTSTTPPAMEQDTQIDSTDDDGNEEGTWWVHSDICECKKCIEEHGDVCSRLF